MLRSELITTLSQRFPALAGADIELVVQEILGAMASSLAEGGRIEIRGFGAFSANYRPPRQGRNPRSGTPVEVRGKYVPHFKPGKELRARVDAQCGA